MAKSSNQKLKLLYLLKILNEQTDEAHPMTVAEMIERLAAQDISAERKSIYSDLEALKEFGVDIITTRGSSTGYYVGSRDFELAELKLLVDAVQSSKFITEKKTLALIKKIEGLAGGYEAKELQRQVYVRGRVKSMNESVFYNVDEIAGAISHDHSITFKYFEYTVTREQKFRRNGELYNVSPFALMWDDENYYMLAWDDAAGRMKHYRVDKMKDIAATEQRRLGKAVFEKTDMSAYSKKLFGMFTGTEQTVRLRVANHLVGAIIDRFGKDTMIVAGEEDTFTVSVPVVVSPHFYSWLFSFGTEMEILSPPSVRDEMARRSEEMLALYRK